MEVIKPCADIFAWEECENQNAKFKPCPFCGCKTIRSYRVWYTDATCHGVVECASCKCDFFIVDIATGKKDSLTDKDKRKIRDIIKKAWNRRVDNGNMPISD